MIVHFYSEYEPRDSDTRERKRVARVTWNAQPWIELPVPDESLARLWREEGKAYPYVIDLFDYACFSQQTPVDAILVYTNSDVCVRSDTALRVAGTMQFTEAFFSFRRDFNHDFHEPIPDALITKGDAYVGSDFYAFRARWWRKYRGLFPDMIIAYELWDAVMRHFIEMTNPGKPVSVPNLTYHRRHGSWWEQPKNRYRLKGQLHNLEVGAAWLRQRGINPGIHGVRLR